MLDGLGSEGPVRCLRRAKALLRPSVLLLSDPRSNKIQLQNNSLTPLLFTERKKEKKNFRNIFQCFVFVRYINQSINQSDNFLTKTTVVATKLLNYACM